MIYEVLVFRDRHGKWAARISVGEHSWRLNTGETSLTLLFRRVAQAMRWLK